MMQSQNPSYTTSSKGYHEHDKIRLETLSYFFVFFKLFFHLVALTIKEWLSTCYKDYIRTIWSNSNVGGKKVQLN